METPEHCEPAYTEDADIEITDLELPDDDTSNTTWLFARAFLRWQRLLTRRRFRLLSGFGLLLLALTLLLLNLPAYPASPRVSAPVPIFPERTPALYSTLGPFPQQDGLVCLVDTAWSPDSQYFAVLGYQQNCPRNSYVPGMVNVYDAHSGNLVAQAQFDDALLQMLRPSFSAAQSKLAIYYYHVLWSPNGQRIALTFSVFVQSASSLRKFLGVLMMDEHGRYAQAAIQAWDNSRPFYAAWDVQNTTAAQLPVIPPALAYHWSAHGRLVPETVLTTTGTPMAPALNAIGNPDGGTSFTIWQPGRAYVLLQKEGQDVYTWQTGFAAWSPDGRYLVDGIDVDGVIEPPGKGLPDKQSAVDIKLAEVPRLPVRDAAFLQVVTFQTAHTTIIAWRPSGRVMAAYDTNVAGFVTLYDCASGNKQFLLLPSDETALSFGSPVVALNWSPDGSRLLVAERTGRLTLWQVSNTSRGGGGGDVR